MCVKQQSRRKLSLCLMLHPIVSKLYSPHLCSQLTPISQTISPATALIPLLPPSLGLYIFFATTFRNICPAGPSICHPSAYSSIYPGFLCAHTAQPRRWIPGVPPPEHALDLQLPSSLDYTVPQ